VRTATSEDLDAVMACEEQAFTHGWSRASWAEEIADHHVAVACAPEVVAVVAMSRVLDTAELLRVIVAPDRRRGGVGRTLVEHGVAWAASHQATEVFLEVSADNEAALRLYEACGFVHQYRRRDYYSPGDDALVMRRAVPGASSVPLNPEEDTCQTP